MIVVTGNFVCKPEHSEAFTAAALEVVAGTNEEPGCAVYSCSRDLTDPTVFVFVEHWADGAALNAHIETDHYRRFRDVVDPLIESRTAHIHKVEKTRVV